MPDFPEPSYANYLIFPPVVQGKAGGSADFGREWLTDHLETDNADVFNARRDESAWRISLGGIVLHPSQIDEWDAFDEAPADSAKIYATCKLAEGRYRIRAGSRTDWEFYRDALKWVNSPRWRSRIPIKTAFKC